MVARIRIDYGAMEQAAKAFSQEGETIAQMVNTLKNQAESLHQTWSGRTADAFRRDMEETILPGIQRLETALTRSSEIFGQIQHIFQDADQQVVGLFKNQDGSSLFGDADDGSAVGMGKGDPVDASAFKNGVDGWAVVGGQIDPKKLLSQIGSTCALYAPLNLLKLSGYDITQNGADSFVNIVKMQEAWWRPDMWLDDNPNWGFKLGASKDVMDKFTNNYQSGDFKGGWFTGDDTADAQKFLTQTVQNGKPVMVNMSEDESFGVSGGHALTVVGVQTDANGNLQNVLVATNWKNTPVYEIPGKSFMDDWMGHNGGQYITVDPAPVPVTPPPPAHSFSKDLQDILSKSTP